MMGRALAITLFVMSLLAILAGVNTLVSLKYEVQEQGFLVDKDKKLTIIEKQVALEQVERQSQQLKWQAYGLFACSVVLFYLTIRQFEVDFRRSRSRRRETGTT